MDTRSQAALNTLHPKFRPIAIAAWTEAQAAMPANVKIIVTEGLRSFERSDELYKLGRTVRNPDGYDKIKKPMGETVTNAPGGSSYHQYGLAFDFAMVTNGKDDTSVGPIWLSIVKIMQSHGMTWGGNFPSIVDDDHFENRFGYGWRQLLTLHNTGKFIPGTTYVQI